MVGRRAPPNVHYLHQLDRQDGGAHQSPLGLFWLGEREGGTVRALRRPSGHITGLPLITSCHTDESSVKVTLADVQYACGAERACVEAYSGHY